MNINNSDNTSPSTYQGLRIVGRFEKITLFLADEGRYLDHEELKSLIADLAENKVILLIRTSRNNYDLKTLENVGVTLFNMPYRRSFLPREHYMETYLHLLLKLLYDNKRVGVVYQGRTLAPFLIGFAMMVLGIHREDSVAKIRELDVEPSEIQRRYLRRRELELKNRYIQMTFYRRSDKPLARLFYFFVDKFF